MSQLRAHLSFTDALRHLRKHSGLDQKDFAYRVGVSPQYQNDLEMGRRMPSVNYVQAVLQNFPDADEREWYRAGARVHGWRV